MDSSKRLASVRDRVPEMKGQSVAPLDVKPKQESIKTNVKPQREPPRDAVKREVAKWLNSICRECGICFNLKYITYCTGIVMGCWTYEREGELAAE